MKFPPATPPQDAQRWAERQQPAGEAVMYQRWEHLLFLHWSYDPALIQSTLPTGLAVDTFDGDAWVGLVPIFMRKVRPRLLPSIPFVSNFLELNLRTYVYDPAGRPGVYFYSLACDQPLAVEAARRLLHLRYEHATMHGDEGDFVSLEVARVGQTAPDRFEYRAHGAAVEAAIPSREFFLIERYRLFAAHDANLRSIRVHHIPYQLKPAELRCWGEGAFTLAGLPAPGRPPDHVIAAEPLEVAVYLPEKVGPPQGRARRGR